LKLSFYRLGTTHRARGRAARSESEIDTAFASLVQLHAGALVVSADPFLSGRREQLVALASRRAVPSIYACANSPLSAA
jgi:hypothetical protein